MVQRAGRGADPFNEDQWLWPAPSSSEPRGGEQRQRQTATDYDRLPYPSMPIAYTQPAHLAALGTLFGLGPPAPDRARVLELGCAAGGNIIPLAARFPGASFLGVDLSQRHIADARDRVAALGLDNVRLLQADLTKLDLSGEQFDYIICHGVYSWVPKAAQDAIFSLCQQYLAPAGMATISYNVLPGWHLRTAIRELCLRYAGTDGSPQRRVARARTALEQIAAAAEQTEPYGLLLQTEARRLKGVPAAYILANSSPRITRPATSRISSPRQQPTRSTIYARPIFSPPCPPPWTPASVTESQHSSDQAALPPNRTLTS